MNEWRGRFMQLPGICKTRREGKNEVKEKELGVDEISKK